MSEWHVTPDYIVSHWTDELFDLMAEKLIERKKGKPIPTIDKTVSTELLAARSHGMIEVKHGDRNR